MQKPTGIAKEFKSRGRHPLLKIGTLAHELYTALSRQPEQTIQQLVKNTLNTSEKQSVNGALQRMKAHGLIEPVPVKKGNRTVTAYRIVQENVTGDPRDVVKIKGVILVNDFGEYSVQAVLHDQQPLAHESNPRPWHAFEFTVPVPRPTEPMKTRNVDPFALQLVASTKKPDMLTVDAEPNHITDESHS